MSKKLNSEASDTSSTLQAEETNMYKTGILILSSSILRRPNSMLPLIQHANQCVENTLYIHIEPEIPKPGKNSIPLTKSLQDFVINNYAKPKLKPLDVRFNLSNLGRCAEKLCLKRTPNVFIGEDGTDILTIVKSRFSNDFGKTLKTFHLPTRTVDIANNERGSDVVCSMHDNVILGGTFDRLHNGHKILLSKASMICNKRLTVGVTHGKMNEKKTLHELMQSTEERIDAVKEFLDDINPSIFNDVVPITDPFGPTITDENYQCLVVSEETLKGGHMVNDRRNEKGWHALEVDVIDLVEDSTHDVHEEAKISSSNERKRLLGTLFKPPVLDPPSRATTEAYVIGFTGGIASGKSSVCKRLEKLGAAVIDCDKLGHVAYVKGTKAHKEIIEEFGEEIVRPDGEINRRFLGQQVFSDKSKLNKLNQIVWPAIEELARKEIEKFVTQGKKVIILDAAVLLEAGWQKMTNEVWVAIVPRTEAIKRIMERNKLSEEEAEKRIDSQISNSERVSQANVVLSTLWQYEVTQKQVEKAWDLLNSRIQSPSKL